MMWTRLSSFFIRFALFLLPSCSRNVAKALRSFSIIAIFSLIRTMTPLNAQSLEKTPADSSSLSPAIEIIVTRTVKNITIDGLLNEEAWNDAQPYEDYFYQRQPEDRAPSREKTRIMVLQDDRALYFGIQCYDAEPERIFASAMRRDTQIWRDDVVELLIDTFRDNRNCYAFVTNPLGVQGDAIISDQGNYMNLQWEAVVDMAGKRNDQGWAAEFAIPFKSLKYRHGETVDWGFNVSRDIKHLQESTYLVPVPRALGLMGKFRGETFGTLKNIQPPDDSFNLEVYPYLLAGRTRVFAEPSRKSDEFNGGIDLRYDITTQLALDLTYNTDFAQAESDQEIVNVTRFNVWRPEKREFFLQSAGLFHFGSGGIFEYGLGGYVPSNFSLFDSRTIGIINSQRVPLIGGGKLTGRAGRTSIAALSLQSDRSALEEGITAPSTNYSVVRLKQDILKNSHIGMMATGQQAGRDDYSHTLGMDGLWNINESIRLDGSLARSFLPTASGNDRAGDVGFILNKEWIDINLRYTHIDSLFNPRLGFILRPNIRSTNGSLMFTKWFNNRWLQNIGATSQSVYITDHHQVVQTRENSLLVSLLGRNGDQIQIGATRSYEFVPMSTSIRHLRIDPGVYGGWTQSLMFQSYNSRPLYTAASFRWGDLFHGRQQSLELSGSAQISRHLLWDVDYSYNYLDLPTGSLTAHVVAGRWTYSLTPKLFAKAYLQWNTADERFSANFLIDYTFRPKSHIYLVYNENQNTLLQQPQDRLIMMKMTYLWQI